MATVTQSIRILLDQWKTGFNDDLVELYAPTMEVQANVKTRLLDRDVDKVYPEKKDGSKSKSFIYSDGLTEWWPLRARKNSDTEPWFKDYPMKWPVEEYVTDVGISGWDWVHRVSRLVGYDLDKLFEVIGDDGHAKGLTAERIIAIDAILAPIPYVMNRRSTRGAGRHIWIPLDDILCENHTVHAALARAVMLKLARDTGIDFPEVVDCYGSIIFIASNRATRENRGYECLQKATAKLTEDDLPGWRNHVSVNKKRLKAKRARSADETESTTEPKARTEDDMFEELAASCPTFERDAEHKRIMLEVTERGWPADWNEDHGYYETHTYGAAEVHKSLGLLGIFKTNSLGTDKTRANAMFFPRPNGGFYCLRFQDAAEDASWKMTSSGRSYCLYNVTPDLRSACIAAGAVEGSAGFTFPTVEQAQEAANALDYKLPELSDRPVNFKIKGNSVVVDATRKDGETPAGWSMTSRTLSKVLGTMPIKDCEQSTNDYDDLVRHIVCDDDGINRDGGYMINATGGTWNITTPSGAKDVLMSTGLSSPASSAARGIINLNPWHEVNEPFQPTFLPNRQWNMRGAQLRFEAAVEPGPTGHWDKIFDHCGEGLDDAVQECKWCLDYGVKSGGDYLRLWLASLLRNPKQKLPYLFFVSEGANGQSTGKSTFHRGIDLLFRRGSVEAKLALNENYNARLAGCVFGYLEDVSLDAKSYSRVKQWLDAPRITIRKMRRDAYSIPNYSHFVQSGNHTTDCYIEVGDTRIQPIEVFPILPADWLDWSRELEPTLVREAPAFLEKLNRDQMPPPFTASRFYLPVFETPTKRTMLEAVTKAEGKGKKTLFDVLHAFALRCPAWEGTTTDLIKELGSSRGEWSSASQHFSRQIKDEALVKRLIEVGVTISYPTARKVSITFKAVEQVQEGPAQGAPPPGAPLSNPADLVTDLQLGVDL